MCVCVCTCARVCVLVHVCARMCSGVSSLSVLAHGWLCYATSAEETCFSPVTGHPLTCVCSVGWAFTLSSLTAADIHITIHTMVVRCTITLMSVFVGSRLPLCAKWSFLRHLWSVNGRWGSCGRS